MVTAELDPKKKQILDAMASWIQVKGLDVVAVLFIESVKPLHNLGSNVLAFFEPFMNILIRQEKLELFREAMTDVRYVDYLLEQIEKPGSSTSRPDK